MDLIHLVPTLDLEAASLEVAVRGNPALRPFFALDFSNTSVAALKTAYLRLLKVKADYVAYTVPMLKAAGEALRSGDDQDRAWSELFLGYANDETDTDEAYGHHIWAKNDMIALGAPASLLDAPPHPSVAAYARFFVDEAPRHPYAILGCKGVLEHLSIRISDDLVKGVVESGMEGAEQATTFFGHHGILDLEHVRAGDANLERLAGSRRRLEVLEGAYFTSGSYRAFLHFAL